MGESKLKRAKCEEMRSSCAAVQTVTGRVQVRWETESAATPMGQLAYFIEFLNLTGLWSRWLESCPLAYASPNAPSRADVLGTWMLSVLSGHRRYSHVTAGWEASRRVVVLRRPLQGEILVTGEGPATLGLCRGGPEGGQRHHGLRVRGAGYQHGL